MRLGWWAFSMEGGITSLFTDGSIVTAGDIPCISGVSIHVDRLSYP